MDKEREETEEAAANTIRRLRSMGGSTIHDPHLCAGIMPPPFDTECPRCVELIAETGR